MIWAEQRCLITSNVIFVGGVDFFYSSVAEGQFSHPVHASPHACGQTKIGAGGSCVETVSAKVVRTETKMKKDCQHMLTNGTVYSDYPIKNKSCTSDPGRCHRRIRRQYGPGHIPGIHRTHTLSNVGFTHNIYKAIEFREGYFLGNYFPHVSDYFLLETTYLFRNFLLWPDTRVFTPSPFDFPFILLNHFSTFLFLCPLSKQTLTSSSVWMDCHH